MLIERVIKTFFFDVEGIRILHRKFAHAQEPALGPRFVTVLRVNLIPDLRHLFVRTQFACEVRKYFFGRHPQANVGAATIFEAEHLLAHHIPPSRLVPDLSRVKRRELELLTTELVHFFTNDFSDLLRDAVSHREQGVDSGHELTHEPRAQQQLVAYCFCITRIVSKSRKKRL